ncbi:hypothetical protein PMAYCL1PPCAC_16904, partial [Pristionchus mayeri]
ACGNCPDPNLETALTQLPAPFRTGYYFQMVAAPLNIRIVYCFFLTFTQSSQGFNGASATVTGLEYTGKGPQTCGEFSKWQNGGLEISPTNLLMACLQ